MSSKKKVELVIANATKINASDSLVVVVSPQYADMLESIYFALEDTTGHNRHAVLPIAVSDIKFYRVQNDLMIANGQDPLQRVDLTGPQVLPEEGTLLDKDGSPL